PFSILFRGCSSMIMYEAGVLAALQELSPDMLQRASRIYGASSGSLIAVFSFFQCNIGKGSALAFVLCLKRNTFMGFVPGGRILTLVRELLDRYLPSNAHQLVSGKLHVIVTRVRDWSCVVLSDFTSREDLIQAIICSCFIPLYFGLLPPKYHGVRYVDGELAMWRANLVSRTTITVSGFAGEYDICPKDSPAAFLTFQLSDCILYISKKNICRLQYIF
ncbi:PLPL1 protein, partial [Urocolius indicus]|nr:PLPL1 protein [Urocolius indicus]